MSKKILIITAVVIVIFSTFLFFNKEPNTDTNLSTKFFKPSEILSTDTIVRVTDNGFDPGTITINVGGRVVWLNDTKDYVWPASDPHPTHGDYPGFDPEEPFLGGEVWAFKFDKVGTWGYHNHLKPSQRAKVVVNN